MKDSELQQYEQAKLTPAARVYGEICGDEKYRSISWIANVLITGCGKPATRLRALKALIDGGHEVGLISFTMPYEGILLDGKAVETMPLLDKGEVIPYNKLLV